MNMRILELQDEGSWALMIEESNARALLKYRGAMAGLDINYYLSTGKERWYKAYFDSNNILENRKRIMDFLLNEKLFNECITQIHGILKKMEGISNDYKALTLYEKYDLYCEVLCEYIGYYNSVIADTFFQDIYNLVDEKIEKDVSFASNYIKDALFATDNSKLLTHTQAEDLLELSKKYLMRELQKDDIQEYLERYKSITSSSGNPEGISDSEIMDYLKEQNQDKICLQESFLNNLNFRYKNATNWVERTARNINLDKDILTLIRRTSELAYLKILMREVFQKFKIVTREDFLTELVRKISKSQFDYMTIDEIKKYILNGDRISNNEIEKRKKSIVFEIKDNELRITYNIPSNVKMRCKKQGDKLSGDVLLGSGKKKYKIIRLEQDEKGIKEFNKLLNSDIEKKDFAVITNVLRPFLVPKLKGFGALLTQYGGYTSHASVLCRELGINSLISVEALMDLLKTDDLVEIDFDKGILHKVDKLKSQRMKEEIVLYKLVANADYSNICVGNKASNLMRVSEIANIPNGFVLTNYALENIDDLVIQEKIMEEIRVLNCKSVAIRSSHDGEDGDVMSCAGLFESFVNVESDREDVIFNYIKRVYKSIQTDTLKEYSNLKDGKMHVIIQEMIEADISGVILTSNSYYGYDYMLVEYGVGDLCYLMQGEITPMKAYIKKVDVIDGNYEYLSYPAVANDDLGKVFYELAKVALELEGLFSHQVEIEWGVKDKEIYIFQVRPY